MRTGYWGGLLLACALTAKADDVPYTFNYQGVLRGGSGEMLASGQKKIAFRLWDQAVSGTPLWGREFTVQLDTNGLFNVELSNSGAVLSSGPYVTTPKDLREVVASTSSLYLGLTVVGNVEIAPRQQLLSVPYAMMAGDVKSASNGFTVTGELSAKSGVTVAGTVKALTVTVGDDAKNVSLKASAAGSLEIPNLNVQGNATVAGNSTTAGNSTVAGNSTTANLTVNGKTVLGGTVQAFSTKNMTSPGIDVTFPNTSYASKSLLSATSTDGFIVLSIYWGFDIDGDENGNKAYGDFTFTLGSDTRKIRYGQYSKDLDANTFHHYQVITLPVRKGEAVSFVPDSANWFSDKNSFTVEMKGDFVPFGVSQ